MFPYTCNLVRCGGDEELLTSDVSRPEPLRPRSVTQPREGIPVLRQSSAAVIVDAVSPATICFLANPDNGSTTGTILAVDGGMQGLRPRKE
jgi:hypothetical protein